MLNGQLLPSDRFVMNPTYETSALVDLAIPIFLSTEINILTQIGQGCFGKVFKGSPVFIYPTNPLCMHRQETSRDDLFLFCVTRTKFFFKNTE